MQIGFQNLILFKLKNDPTKRQRCQHINASLVPSNIEMRFSISILLFTFLTVKGIASSNIAACVHYFFKIDFRPHLHFEIPFSIRAH